MTRSQYRLVLTGLCALAAGVGPVVFLEDRLRAGYLLGGLAAAFLCWGLLLLAYSAEQRLSSGAQAVMGMGAAILSWVPVSLVAVFDIIPHIFREMPDPFDPVWVMGGLSPLAVPAVACWQWATGKGAFWQATVTGLFRFSVPLFVLRLTALLVGLPEKYSWLFMFTGVMFLVLDGLGFGWQPPVNPTPPPHNVDRELKEGAEDRGNDAAASGKRSSEQPPGPVNRRWGSLDAPG